MPTTNPTLKLCSISDCANGVKARGWCRMHYKRWWRNGDPLKILYGLPLEDRFFKCVQKTNSCWLWTGAKTSEGYGQLEFKGKQLRSNRLSWELYNGPIPDGLHCLHKCDNPPCCNPEHLFLGTNQDNVDDKMKKGRHKASKGVNHGRAKLSEARVKSIRLRHHLWQTPHEEIAKLHGVSTPLIGKIVRRELWKHI